MFDAKQVGRGRDQRQQREGHAERGLAAHRVGARGRDERNAHHADDHGRHGDQLASSDGLTEHAPAEVEQQQQPKREDRLDYGERSEGERCDL
jgi:hypothetical protein